MAEEQRLRANRRIEKEVCGWCGHAIEFGQEVVLCGDCEAAHHADHWDKKGGCAVPGCMSAPLEQMAPPPPPMEGGAPRSRSRGGARRQRSGTADGATAALVCGLIGILFCGIVFGPIAIVNGNKAKAAISRNPRLTGGGMATAGVVLGIVAIVFNVIGFLVVMTSR